jgi:hypothetical protein
MITVDEFVALMASMQCKTYSMDGWVTSCIGAVRGKSESLPTLSPHKVALVERTIGLAGGAVPVIEVPELRIAPVPAHTVPCANCIGTGKAKCECPYCKGHTCFECTDGHVKVEASPGRGTYRSEDGTGYWVDGRLAQLFDGLSTVMWKDGELPIIGGVDEGELKAFVLVLA